MPVSFKAAQGWTNLTPFLTLKGTAYPLIHVLFTQEHPVTIAQSCSAFPCAVKEKKPKNQNKPADIIKKFHGLCSRLQSHLVLFVEKLIKNTLC